MSNTPRITAIILASGKGNRFGRPKLEADHHGEKFLQIILRKLAESGCEEVFIARDLDTPDMLSTLRFALNALQGQTNRGYLIYPVDHPLVQVQTIKSLIEAAIRLPSSVIRPCFSGFRGHPVYIPRELDLNADDSEDGLAGIIRNSSVPRFDLPVDDEAILKNINYPSDLETVTL